MLEKLRSYYEQELGLLGDRLEEFARRYPRVATRLSISGGDSEDMYVQRLMQAFTLLAARARVELDNGAPQFSGALLDVLHPQYLRPFPACSIACLEFPEPPSAPVIVARGTKLTSADGELRFRTVYDVTAAPIRITDARMSPSTVAPGRANLPPDTTLIVSMTFEPTAAGVELATAMPGMVRIHLAGEPNIAATLGDTLLLRTQQAFVEADGSGDWMPLDHLPVTATGFGEDDALLPNDDSGSFIHPLLEYAAFPQKFDFVDINTAALLRYSRTRHAHRITLHFPIGLHPDSRQAQALLGLSRHHFRLFCTPVVNLFELADVTSRRGEPVVEYPVLPVPQKPATYQIFSIDRVRDVMGDSLIAPYNALAHTTTKPGTQGRYWLRRHDEYQARNHPGHETSLILLQEDGKAAEQWPEQIQIDVTCTNRDLPAQMKFGHTDGDLRNEKGAVASRVMLLSQPTHTFRPEHDEDARMRIIALTTANATQLGTEGWGELRRVLRQCMPPGAQTRHIDSVSFAHRRRIQKMFPGKPNSSIVPGLEITVSLDEQTFAEHSMAAFISVIDRYFTRYVPMNSFMQLVVLSKTNGSEIRRCPLRVGRSPLL
ncbi:type VI secretion system baseplate subunit TssF [Paraburkholderia dinghuensis]|uniref:Type VI secretion system baseplate subunit TssF n=1 Tax=Paraburkholderia dinghuensis TaxID=2305225 RepID=A0A3N6P779_9BURK|nr:type VI secretion system baseplate subunit TssF [Paraburkholderia dinghuensis]RQH09893.1 type VI secretion system baseplate subunit TssF [Paraburkholderia dinghuensis]